MLNILKGFLFRCLGPRRNRIGMPLRYLIGLFILAVIGFLLVQKMITPKTPANKPIAVQTIQVKSATMPDTVDTIGSLSAIKEIKLRAAGLGRVAQLLVESGAYVQQGTLLALITAAPELRAPFSGYLTDWQIKAGELVSSGTELVDLVDTDMLTITYRVPEHYAPKLDFGQDVEVKVRAFADKIFHGKVKFISPVVDKKTFTVLIKAEVDNHDKALWPGMSAHIKHIFAHNENALVIPEGALMPSLEGYEVFVVNENKILRKKVTVGVRKNSRAEILSGISLNEHVIIAITDNIKENLDATPHVWEGDW